MAQERDGVFTWYHTDHLGSSSRITDINGDEVRNIAYKSFGEEAENVGTGEDPKYKYTGKEADATGLYYYGARYYDPALSRFITADTVYDGGPQGLNRYSYALNNPIIYRDPTGHYIDADFDDGGYDEGPVAKGNVTGSAKQIEDGTATVHNYYGTHPLSYWGGLAGGADPNATVWDIVSGWLMMASTTPDDLVVEYAQYHAGASGNRLLKAGVFIGGMIFSVDDLASPNTWRRLRKFWDTIFKKRFLKNTFTDFNKLIPDVGYQITNMDSGFLRASNLVNLHKGRITGEVIAEELQHALDYAKGLNHRDLAKALSREAKEKGWNLATEEGKDLANRWWHRRVFVRTIKNIQAETPGFRKLAPYIEGIYRRYKEKAGGSLSLEKILTTDFEGFF